MIEGQKHAWQYLLDKFRAYGGTLSTMDFITDIRLAAEYRRLMCDLRDKGYHIISKKVTPKHWIYTLLEEEKTGQMRMAI